MGFEQIKWWKWAEYKNQLAAALSALSFDPNQPAEVCRSEITAQTPDATTEVLGKPESQEDYTLLKQYGGGQKKSKQQSRPGSRPIRPGSKHAWLPISTNIRPSSQ